MVYINGYLPFYKLYKENILDYKLIKYGKNKNKIKNKIK
jgi:hypothetical protein